MTIKEEISTVSIAATIDLIEICLAEKILTEQELHAFNLSREVFTELTGRIDETDFIALWNKVAQHNHSQGVGLRVGQIINPNAKGLLASWISQTCTLKAALNTFIQHISLMNPSEAWTLSEENNICSLILTINKEKSYPDMAIERSMSSIMSWAQVLSGQNLSILEASFTFPEPEYTEAFDKIFGKKIQFNRQENCLKFYSQYLGLSIVSSNYFLKEIIESKAKVALKALSSDAPICSQVILLIKDLMDKQQPISVSIISEQLSISRQTLYRELKKHNTDFQSLFDSTRKIQALELLKSDIETIDGISLKLGYKDSSSFYKAFKRWYGQSPSAYALAVIDDCH